MLWIVATKIQTRIPYFTTFTKPVEQPGTGIREKTIYVEAVFSHLARIASLTMEILIVIHIQDNEKSVNANSMPARMAKLFYVLAADDYSNMFVKAVTCLLSAVVQRTYKPYFDLGYSQSKHLQPHLQSWSFLRLRFFDSKFQHATWVPRLTDTALRKAIQSRKRNETCRFSHSSESSYDRVSGSGCLPGWLRFGPGVLLAKLDHDLVPSSSPMSSKLPAVKMTRWPPLLQGPPRIDEGRKLRIAFAFSS